MTKRVLDLKPGDRTHWYTVIGQPERGTDDNGPCVIVMVEWTDGGRGPRVFDINTYVEVL